METIQKHLEMDNESFKGPLYEFDEPLPFEQAAIEARLEAEMVKV